MVRAKTIPVLGQLRGERLKYGRIGCGRNAGRSLWAQAPGWQTPPEEVFGPLLGPRYRGTYGLNGL